MAEGKDIPTETLDEGVLTPEKKQELLDQARRQADQEIPATTASIGPDMAPAQPLGEDARPSTQPVAPAAGYVPGFSGEGVENFRTPVYGPYYDDYKIIMTTWGEFGVPVGHVLWFTAEPRFSAKSGEFFIGHIPHTALPEDAPPQIKELVVS